MPRGHKPLIALSDAKHIPEKRGEARHFRHELDMICTFVIYNIGLVAHVRVRRVERIRFRMELLEREADKRSRSAPVHCIFTGNFPRALSLYTQRYVPVFPGARKFARGARPVRESAARPAIGPGTNDARGRTGPGRKIRWSGVRAGLTRSYNKYSAPPLPSLHS
jgi:hypothetical protein